MGIFDGILLASDLDGTLLNSSGEISQNNLDAIEFFKREGGLFAIVTGRMPYYAADIYRRARSNALLCCMNGGAVYDTERAEYLWHSTISDNVIELIRFVDKNFSKVGISINTYNAAYFCKENPIMEFFRRVAPVPNLVCDYQAPPGPIAKIVFGVESEEEISDLTRALSSHPLASEFTFLRSEKYLYEILPGGCNKGVGLLKLAECSGIPINRTIAIGDYDNDIEMIKTARVGIAVANARDELKAVADRITVSNDEHAIAKIIEDLRENIT